jgi:hypothetical protein
VENELGTVRKRLWLIVHEDYVVKAHPEAPSLARWPPKQSKLGKDGLSSVERGLQKAEDKTQVCE